MLSYTLSSRPTVLAIYRLLPCTLADIHQKSGMSLATNLDAIKYLLAVKQAYVSSWEGVTPIFTAGWGTNVPRPTPADVRFKREFNYRTQRRKYGAKYREENKEKRKAYYLANKDKLNAARNALVAVKRAIAKGELVFLPSTEVKTNWIKT